MKHLTFKTIASAIFMCATLGTMASKTTKKAARPTTIEALNEKDLQSKVETAITPLKKAIALKASKPNADIMPNLEYFAWASQCMDYLEENEKSELWVPCLRYVSYLFQAEDSGETMMQILPVEKKFPKKFAETLLKLNPMEREQLMEQVKVSKALDN